VTIGLVLSGGGARCFAQIGMLKALEEADIRPSAISGASTGAILGALYAAGHQAEGLYDIVSGIDYSTFLRPGGRGGLISHAGVEEVLKPHLPERFEDLDYPLAVVAVDIQSAELLIFHSGPLLKVLCASNAFPGLFVPVYHQGRYLMDGGILDNVPIDIGQMLTNDPLVVLDTVPSPKRPLDFEGKEDKPDLLGRLLAPLRGEAPEPPLLIEVLEKAYTITQSRLIELDFGIQDFGRLEEAYRLGYEAAKRALEQADLKG
jgi:NTE family protein